MDEFCFVCNQKSLEWRRNFAEIKSQHTQTPVCDFIKSFLLDFRSVRNIEDESNCICAECLQRINDYDWTCQQAIEQEAKLRHTLITTEVILRNLKNQPIGMKNHVKNGFNDVVSSEVRFVSNPDAMDIHEQQSTSSLLPFQPSPSKPLSIGTSNSIPIKQKTYIIRSNGQLCKVILANRDNLSQTTDELLHNGKERHTMANKMPALKFPKPIYPYSCLIALALKNSRNGSLFVSEIYEFLCTQFPYFQMAPISWKNCVRHTLCLSNSFIRVGNKIAAHNRRKKSVWTINPAKIAQLDADIQNSLRKYRTTNLKAMAVPDNLPALLRGDMEYGGLHDSWNDIKPGNDTEGVKNRA